MDGGDHVSFRRLMALKRIDDNNFESLTAPFAPASTPVTINRAFGGHVYAQAAWAASQTVASGLFIHNVTGHFLLPGLITTPFIYHVRRTRDGGVYALRTVEAYQQSDVAAKGKVPCFVSTISFKREESQAKTISYGHQNAPKDHIRQIYASVLEDKKPQDHPFAPISDVAWWTEPQIHNNQSSMKRPHPSTFPGCQTRKVNMTPYNPPAEPGGGPDNKIVTDWRQLTFYKMYLDADPHQDESNLNLHACAHLYASDRNSLFLVQRALGYSHIPAQVGSLSHTVIFHRSPEDLRTFDATSREPRWFVQEAWTSNSGGNRVCHDSRLWDYEGGLVLGSTIQDGMLRLPKDVERGGGSKI